MRKILYTSVIIAAMTIVGSCKKEEPNVNPAEIKDGVTILSASFEGEPSTKSIVDVDNMEAGETNRAYFYWMNGDKIGVYTNEAGQADFTLASEERSSNGQFTHQGVVTLKGQAIYPYNTDHVFDSNGNVTTVNMPTSYTFTGAYNPNTNVPMIGQAGGSIELEHLGGAVLFRIGLESAGATKLEFTAKHNTITGNFTPQTEGGHKVIKTNTLASGTPATVSTNNKVTLNFSQPLGSGNYDFYIPLPVGEYGVFTITVSAGSTKIFERTSENRYMLTRGKIIWFSDTSYEDANCIMTQPSVVYKVNTNRINEFWGNPNYVNDSECGDKIVDGTEWKVEQIWNQDVLGNGSAWNIRFLTKDEKTESYTANPDGTYTGMHPFYYEVYGGDITDIGGNILVGVKRKNPETGQWEDTYLWSWHIWITDYVAPSVKQQAEGMTASHGAIFYYTNTDKMAFAGKESIGGFYYGREVHIGKAIMDRSLGAVLVGVNSNIADEFVATSTGTILSTYTLDIAKQLDGCYYQFGRKDPFYSGLRHEPVKTRQEIYYGVKYPDTYIQFNGDWTSTTRWDGAKNDLWSDGNDQAKSIFDPCPRGWRVPSVKSDGSKGMWSNFGNSITNNNPRNGSPFCPIIGNGTDGNFARGRLLHFNISSAEAYAIRDWYAYTGWFDHATLYHEDKGITTTSWGNAGDYWTSSIVNDGNRGYILNLTNSLAMGGMWNRAAAFPIRCVQQ